MIQFSSLFSIQNKYDTHPITQAHIETTIFAQTRLHTYRHTLAHTHTHTHTHTHIQFKCAHKSKSFTVYIGIFILFRTITNTHSSHIIYTMHTHKQTNTCTYFAQIHAHTMGVDSWFMIVLTPEY